MSKLCCISGCDKPAYRAGMCNSHRIRMSRHGTPDGGRRSPLSNHCQKSSCPAAKKVWAHVHYIQNSDAYKAKSALWRKENPEQYSERTTNYFAREDVKERMRRTTREWTAANPERKREMDLNFKAKNPAKVTSYKARYRASRKQATPPWLTDNQNEQILAVYEEARRLTEQTGIPHEVDHIVPLAGKIVSGLHVPWNLRAIPKVENNRRPRIYRDGPV